MSDTLRILRDKAGMTQEHVAERMDVSVNTIQNWERTGKIPKESLHALLDLYGVDQRTRDKAVLDVYGENREIAATTEDVFPYFLFEKYPNLVKVAKNANLSVSEIELFGYLYHFDNYNKGVSYDYDFIKDNGGMFELERKRLLIIMRIGNIEPTEREEWMDPVEDWDDKDAQKSLAPILYSRFSHDEYENGFSFTHSSKEFIMDHVGDLPFLDDFLEDHDISIRKLLRYCKEIKTPVRIGTSNQSYISAFADSSMIPEMVKSDSDNGKITYSLPLDDFYKQCIEIVSEENDTTGIDYWLKLTDIGEKAIEWGIDKE